MKRHTKQIWWQTTAMMIVGLLVCSGVANAYCSVDDYPGRSATGATQDLHAHRAPGSIDDLDEDACTGLDVPDQDHSKSFGPWDGASIASTKYSYTAFSPQPTRPIAVRRLLLWEPVFNRFPRLLI